MNTNFNSKAWLISETGLRCSFYPLNSLPNTAWTDFLGQIKKICTVNKMRGNVFVCFGLFCFYLGVRRPTWVSTVSQWRRRRDSQWRFWSGPVQFSPWCTCVRACGSWLSWAPPVSMKMWGLIGGTSLQEIVNRRPSTVFFFFFFFLCSVKHLPLPSPHLLPISFLRSISMWSVNKSHCVLGATGTQSQSFPQV